MKTHSHFIITRLTALFLAFTLFFTSNCNALSNVQATTTNEENVILGETNYCCKLRKEPQKSSEAVITLPESTLLYITGSTSNSHGNVWFETSYFGDTVYCYSGNISEHEHDFTLLVNNEDSTYACRCGALDTEVDGMSNTCVPGLAIPAIEILRDVVVAAGAYYGARKVGEHIIPVMVNTAGSLVSITVDELQDKLSKLSSDQNNENEENSESTNFYKCKILTKDNTDSLELVDFTKPLSINEACDYVDSMLRLDGVYKRLKDFEIKACNIYTPNEADAATLCNKIIGCQQNAITKYGNKTGTPYVFDTHSSKYISGSYLHYHLFRMDDKSVVHILYGNPLSSSADIPEI